MSWVPFAAWGYPARSSASFLFSIVNSNELREQEADGVVTDIAWLGVSYLRDGGACLIRNERVEESRSPHASFNADLATKRTWNWIGTFI